MSILPMPLDEGLFLLADWMEISAILAHDGTFSREDFKGEARRNDRIPALYPETASVGHPTAMVADLMIDLEQAVTADVLSEMMAPQPATGEELMEEAVDVAPPPDIALSTSSTMEEDERLGVLVDEVLSELRHRAEIIGDAYPFEVHQWHICRKDRSLQHVPYEFCMLLSYLCLTDPDTVDNAARKLFEKIATLSILGYLGNRGRAINMGSPRDPDEIATSFGPAVQAVMDALGEGGQFIGTQGSPMDDGIDIVAWVPFPDGGTGKFILYGNCMTGKDVTGLKCSELVVNRFYTTWVSPRPISPYVTAYLFPHRIELDSYDWPRLVTSQERGQIIFERCRLASLAQPPDEHVVAAHLEWVDARLAALSQEAAS